MTKNINERLKHTHNHLTNKNNTGVKIGKYLRRHYKKCRYLKIRGYTKTSILIDYEHGDINNLHLSIDRISNSNEFIIKYRELHTKEIHRQQLNTHDEIKGYQALLQRLSKKKLMEKSEELVAELLTKDL